MKQYDSYKPSGVEWIGDIPSHWEIQRLRFLCEFRNGYTPSKSVKEYWDEGTIPWYRMEDIRECGRKLSNAKQYITEEAVKGMGLFSSGSFILATTATIGEHALLIADSLANQQFTNLKIRESLKDELLVEFFYYYLFLIGEYCKSTTKTATFPAVDMNDLKNVAVTLPPLEEQEQIAKNLDVRCAEIDGLIEKEEKTITLLDELKQSIITEAVTRGLDPTAPLKPSGVEWIGDIPSHWEYIRIKYMLSRSSAGVWGADALNNENDIICYRVADFDYNQGVLKSDNITLRNIEKKQLDGRLVSQGDLLIEKSGGGEVSPVGRVVRVNFADKATCSNFIHSITVKTGYDSIFLYYYFHQLYSKRINLLFFNQTTGIQNLQIDKYLSQGLFLPPLDEQKQIAKYLDERCGEIEAAKAKKLRQIELLRELKQTLISDAVTGRIKVISSK